MCLKMDKSSWHLFVKDLAVSYSFPSLLMDNARSCANHVRISLSIFKSILERYKLVTTD